MGFHIFIIENFIIVKKGAVAKIAIASLFYFKYRKTDSEEPDGL